MFWQFWETLRGAAAFCRRGGGALLSIRGWHGGAFLRGCGKVPYYARELLKEREDLGAKL